MCEVAAHDFNNQGLGCNISGSPLSPKRGIFDSFRGKSSPKNKLRKSKESSPIWSNVFGKKGDARKKEEEDRTAELLSQLQLEGRSDEEIAMHLSFIHDIPSPTPAPVAAPTTPKKRNGVSRFFKAILDEFSLTEEGWRLDDNVAQSMTVSLAATPFFGAPPPNVIPFEDFMKLEPVCLGKRENNLPCCKHDGTPLPGNQTNCPVCLCEFTEGERLKSTPCIHFYHKECIDRWLMVGNSCPLCKAPAQ